MKWGGIFGVTALLVLIFFYEWPTVKKEIWKVKIVFLAFISIGWFLAILLILYPDLPGPSQLIDFIYEPIGKFWRI